MPESSFGFRRDSVWKTRASISMPVPAIAQAIAAPITPVVRPKAEGNAKMPEPIIEPTTSATSSSRDSFCSLPPLLSVFAMAWFHHSSGP